jgi:hypothetical protein
MPRRAFPLLLSRAPSVALIVVLLLGAVLAGTWQSSPRRALGAGQPDLGDWQLPQLVEHLNAHGMGLRIVAVTEADTGMSATSAFLTTTGPTWSELNSLPKVRDKIDLWRGTLYCERQQQPDARAEQIELWGDCCLVIGPFVFFGDRELLARAATILRSAETVRLLTRAARGHYVTAASVLQEVPGAASDSQPLNNLKNTPTPCTNRRTSACAGRDSRGRWLQQMVRRTCLVWVSYSAMPTSNSTPPFAGRLGTGSAQPDRLP